MEKLKDHARKIFGSQTVASIISIARARGACDDIEQYENLSSVEEMLETAPLDNLIWFMGPFLVGEDLAGEDLSLISLVGADLAGADLAGATITAATFRGANITAADFEGVVGVPTT